MRFLPIIFATICLARFVSAGIYGTSPIASTVWSAGSSEFVTWMDDKSVPRLADMGNINVELFGGDDTRIATLAEGIRPTVQNLTVWISPSWAHNESDYYIRFSCNNPLLSIYTASFTIMNMSSTLAFGQGVLNHSSTNPGPSLYTPYLTLVLPDTTYISPLAPRPTSATPSNTPVTVEEENEHLRGESGQKMTSNAIRDYGLRMNLERLKFRLVFILWPALVGMTMAL